MPEPRRMLVHSPVLPDPDADGAARRVMDEVELAVSSGWRVTFAAPATEPPDRRTHAEKILRDRSVACHWVTPAQLENLVSSEPFDLAIAVLWPTAEVLVPILRRASPRTRVVVDAIDLQFLRRCRGAFVKQAAPAKGKLDAAYAGEMVRELNAYAAADAVLTISPKESLLLDDLVGNAVKSYWLPDLETAPASTTPYDKRRGIVLAGDFRQPANVAAVEFLCRDVLPRLDPLLLVRHPVHVVGDRAETLQAATHGSPHVRLVPRVPSLLPWLAEARVAVMPLLYGAGIKRTLLQAILAATPAVSTTIGAEGLNLRPDQDILVADDAPAFAAATARVLEDKRLWKQLSQAGRDRVFNVHGHEPVAERFNDALLKALSRPRVPAADSKKTA